MKRKSLEYHAGDTCVTYTYITKEEAGEIQELYQDMGRNTLIYSASRGVLRVYERMKPQNKRHGVKLR
jgi:hypothetical protein